MKLCLAIAVVCCVCAVTSGHAGEHVPPTLPDRFSLRMEKIDNKGRQISNSRHVVDYVGKFMRSDFAPRHGVYSRTLSYYGNRPLIVINDFNSGHEFVIDRSRGNCSISNISVHDRAAITDGNNNVIGMKHPYDMFRQKDLKYNGTALVRTLPVERYRRYFNKTQIQIYYLRSPWGSVTEQDEHPQEGVPVAIDLTRYNNLTKKNETQRIHVYDFTKDHTEIGTVPIAFCFERFKTVTFRLNGNPGIHRFSGIVVKYAITQALAKAMNVSFIRITIMSYQVPTDKIKYPYVIIVFRIYQAVKSPGNLAKPVVETTVEKAIQNLEAAVYDGLIITIPDFQAQDRMAVMRSSVKVSDLSKPVQTNVAPRETSANAGVVAAVGIVLLIVGLAAGFAAAFLFRKRFPCDKEVPYESST